MPGDVPLTSLEWFYKQRPDEDKEALKPHPEDREWNAACEILKTATNHIVVEERIHGPFPLCHMDLHLGNLLFDQEYNLTGVIDWTQAQTVPLERLTVSPEFMTFPSGSPEKNEKIARFRQLTRDFLREMENRLATETVQVKLSTILGTKRAEIIHKSTYSFPHRALWDGRAVSKLLFGDNVSWEQIVELFGNIELGRSA